MMTEENAVAFRDARRTITTKRMKTNAGPRWTMLLFLLVCVASFPARAYYDPTIGRWISRDPIGERGEMNLYGFVHNNPQRFVDPLGLRIYVLAPDVGGLDYTHFDDYVLNGFQRVIGDCAKLHKAPIIRQVETGFLFWKRTESRLVGWELYYTDEKPNCVCNSCWKTLKGALGDNLPTRNIYISRGDRPFFLDNAATLYRPDGVSQVGIYEGISGPRPEVGSSGQVVWNPVRFDVVLWHEAIGHGYLGLGHPNTPSNQRGGPGPDPTIIEENKARNCLRLQGISINDRVPTYYGWK
jgi:hypothetical protein